MHEVPENAVPEPGVQPGQAAPDASPPAARELPLDTRLLSDAVIELNISRKNVGIYPPGHVQIVRSIERAYDVLCRLFEIREEMTLGVAKDILFVGQDYLDQKNPVYRDFALSLNSQGIAAVTFCRGLDREELVSFHRVITTKPEEIIAAGGIGTVMSGAGVPHIRVIPIDYASFHLTDEQEIFRSQAKTVAKAAEKAAEKPAGGMWMDFVSLISSGSLAAPGEGGISLKDAVKFDPAELARLLNERKLNTNAAVQTYDTIISSHVRQKSERKRSKDQSETLMNFNALLKDLHPDLRKQFLSSAFKNLSDHAVGAGAEDVLGGMGDDMIIDMLRQASTEGREISPTLTGLLSKLANVRDRSRKRPEPEMRAPAGVPGADGSPDILPEHMDNLFRREKYEDYVEEEYDRLLKGVSEKAETMAATRTDRFPVRDYLRTFEDEYLDFQIGRALVAFMEERIDAEDYREFAGKLATLVPDLLKSGNFPLLIDILTSLRWHLSDKKEEEIRTAAADVLKVFWQPEFIAGAVAAFDAWAQTKARVAGELLLALGPATVPGLLDLYAADATPGGRRVVFDLLAAFGDTAVGEAIKRLGDPRPAYVRNLLMLVRRAGSAPAVRPVRPLLKHADARVRLEALAVLLRFKEPSSADLLRKEIRSGDPDVSAQAIFLAGQYRVAETVEHILPLLRSVVFFESDYRVNEEIIRALGEIGDARAVPELEKLARSSFSLYPQRHQSMKRLLFDSLGRYPRERIGGLLRIGERSGDDRIMKACRALAGRT